MLVDDEVSLVDFLGLRSEIYSYLIFYLSDDNLHRILAEVSSIADYRDRSQMLTTFARITNILQDDLGSASGRTKGSEQTLVALWQRYARLVGNIMCMQVDAMLPCHRVVFSTGRLAPHYPAQAFLLAAEGVTLTVAESMGSDFIPRFLASA